GTVRTADPTRILGIQAATSLGERPRLPGGGPVFASRAVPGLSTNVRPRAVVVTILGERAHPGRSQVVSIHSFQGVLTHERLASFRPDLAGLRRAQRDLPADPG